MYVLEAFPRMGGYLSQLEVSTENERVLRNRIQCVQCADRWSGNCLNKDCWAFQNINGKYCCTKLSFQNLFSMKILEKTK
jgi:hypothetical protein